MKKILAIYTIKKKSENINLFFIGLTTCIMLYINFLQWSLFTAPQDIGEIFQFIQKQTYQTLLIISPLIFGQCYLSIEYLYKNKYFLSLPITYSQLQYSLLLDDCRKTITLIVPHLLLVTVLFFKFSLPIHFLLVNIIHLLLMYIFAYIIINIISSLIFSFFPLKLARLVSRLISFFPLFFILFNVLMDKIEPANFLNYFLKHTLLIDFIYPGVKISQYILDGENILFSIVYFIVYSFCILKIFNYSINKLLRKNILKFDREHKFKKMNLFKFFPNTQFGTYLCKELQLILRTNLVDNPISLPALTVFILLLIVSIFNNELISSRFQIQEWLFLSEDIYLIPLLIDCITFKYSTNSLYYDKNGIKLLKFHIKSLDKFLGSKLLMKILINIIYFGIILTLLYINNIIDFNILKYNIFHIITIIFISLMDLRLELFLPDLYEKNNFKVSVKNNFKVKKNRFIKLLVFIGFKIVLFCLFELLIFNFSYHTGFIIYTLVVTAFLLCLFTLRPIKSIKTLESINYY